MIAKTTRSAFVSLVLGFCLCSCNTTELAQDNPENSEPENSEIVEAPQMGMDQIPATAMNVQYLEIVTLEVDATCSALEAMHAVNFGEPLPGFGNARTAALAGGGMLGVRGPLRPDEEPVVRPYLLVDDIDASVQAAEAAGAQIALPPMEMPGQGKFAIYILGGIEHGLWMR